MKNKVNTLLRLINRFLYITSAGLLLAGLFLSSFYTPVLAANANINQNTASGYQLNLSHIACVDNQVEVHFVLLNVPDGVTPGNSVTFSLRINGGTAVTEYASRGKNSGNVWHYSYYGSVNGYYDVLSAFVYVGSTRVDLHNPDSYSSTDQRCSSSTATFTATASKTSIPSATFTPTATQTSVPTATFTPTSTYTTIPTATFTPTSTALPSATPSSTFTPTVVVTTETVIPTTETVVPPTETPVPTTETEVPLTETLVPTTETVIPPTETPIPSQETPVPTTETPAPPQETSVPTVLIPVTALEPVSIVVDPFCTVDNRVQWTVENPNNVNFVLTSFRVDGAPQQPGFSAAPGSTKLTTTSLGTHTVSVFYGESQSVSLTYTLAVCPLSAPATGGLLIPVTGADKSSGFFFGGLGFGGLGLVLSAVRKLFLH